ncbi:MAG: glycosyltransferase family 2 protein [Ruminococcaceae bacterium]|nr:glycosyltransferase family 2 protein [Oscillospiraceae bacterium]
MLFSVIVPIYKVEKYLNRCIESVLGQTCEDFELILVDDGSPDNCPAICDEYAAANSNVKVIHKKNGGLVSARQAGVQAATGEYVFNLDGDDALIPNALECAKDIIVKTNADMVCFPHQEYRNGATKAMLQDIVPVGFYPRKEMEKCVYPHILSDKNMQNLPYFLCGKAIRRRLITPHQLNVTNKISLGEDLSCLIPCYLDAQSLYIDDTPVYLYTIRDDSLTTHFTTKQLTDLIEVVNGLYRINQKKPMDFDEQLARYSCFMCFAILAAAAEGGHFQYLNEIKGLILNSVNKELIKKAQFERITPKTKIGVALMKKGHIKTVFYFLYLIGQMKRILRKGE